MPATRRNQAAWEKAAVDLSDDLGQAAELDTQGINAVADATGLTANTITDCMYRPVVTQPTNPRTYLCRPKYRVGSTPYWSPEQVADAVRVASMRRTKVGRGPDLPMVADDADVVGVREIAAAVARHEQTVRKWTAGSYTTAHIETDDDASVAEPFPAPAGRRAQPPGRRRGNPETVYDRLAVRDWIRSEIGEEVPQLGTRTAAAALRTQLIEQAQCDAAQRAGDTPAEAEALAG